MSDAEEICEMFLSYPNGLTLTQAGNYEEIYDDSFVASVPSVRSLPP